MEPRVLSEVVSRLRALADEAAGTTLPEASWSAGDREAILARQRAAQKPVAIMDEAGLLVSAAIDAGAFGGIDGILLRDHVKRTLERGGRYAFQAAAATMGHKRPPVVLVWEAAWIAAGIRLLADAIEADANEGRTGAPAEAKPKGRDRRAEIAQACILVQDHPEFSDAAIAGKVGLHRSTLARSEIFQRAAALAREPRKNPSKGFKSGGDFDAWDDE